jgi:hypothetical protein
MDTVTSDTPLTPEVKLTIVKGGWASSKIAQIAPRKQKGEQ